MIAFTREPSPKLRDCELTHLPRRPIDVGLARHQHEAYEAALRALGAEVRRVEPAPEHPDGVFVEDAAIVLPELAVITRPGAPSRRGEVEDLATALAPHRALVRVPAPATLDGGDVLVDGRTVFVGHSERTGPAAHAWLRGRLDVHGYDVRVVPVNGCLHLKTAVTAAAPGTFLLNPRWVPAASFSSGRVIEVDPAEAWAANVLRVGAGLIQADGAPRTRRRLEAFGLEVIVVDVSELARAEGGVTCCAVLVPDDSQGRHSAAYSSIHPKGEHP
jgi:dimethylargininase